MKKFFKKLYNAITLPFDTLRVWLHESLNGGIDEEAEG